MTMGERDVAEAAIGRVIMEFFHCLDDTQFDALVQLFAPEGVWHRQGQVLRGRAMVREALARRPAGTVTRHLVTNLLVTHLEDERSVAKFYMTVFRREADTLVDGPVPMELPHMVAACEMVLAYLGNAWRIMELKAVPSFRR